MPDFKGIKEMYRLEFADGPAEDKPSEYHFSLVSFSSRERRTAGRAKRDRSVERQAARRQVDSRPQNRTFVLPVEPQEEAKVQSQLPYRQALLQGKKHADNPWIQKMAAKEAATAALKGVKPLSGKRRQEMSSGLKEGDREGDIIAKEFTLALFQVPDKRECRQLTRYDTWENDLSPEEWVRRCLESGKSANATSPVYNGETYVWQPVKVLSYDGEKKKYRITVLENGQEKLVTRLALMFYDEDKKAFSERLKQCRERRDNVESELRFQDYVDSFGRGTVTGMPGGMLEAVTHRAQIREDRFDRKHSEVTTARLIMVIDAVYRRTMKKCLVLQELTNGATLSRMEEMHIPIKLDRRTAPYMAVVDVGRNTRKRKSGTSRDLWGDDLSYIKNAPGSFIKGLPRVEKKAIKMTDLKAKRRERRLGFVRDVEKQLLEYAGATKMINSFTDEFQRVCQEFKKRRLFQTDTQRLQLPMRCSHFIAIQDKKIAATTTDVVNNWRFQILHDMREKIGSKFTFDIPDIQKYEESPMRKLIRKYDLMFRTHLAVLYTDSIRDFVCFLRSFTHPEPNQLWRVSSVPLIEIDIRYTGSDKKKEEKKDDKESKEKKHKHKQDEKRKKELKKKEKKELLFKPDIEQCKKDMLMLLDKVVDSSRKVLVLETEDFNVFLSERKTPAFQLATDCPEIAEAKGAVQQMVDERMIAPRELLARFKKYEYLMTTETSTMKKVMEKEKPPTTTELKDQLDGLTKAAYEVQTLATDLVQFSMFQVNTSMVKKYLAYRAGKLKTALLQSIQKHCKKTIADILSKYVQLLSKLEDKPTSKDAYKELKMYLKDSNKRMEELRGRHDLVKLHIDLLEENLVKVDKDDERDFWKVHQYPGQLRTKIAKGNNNLINYEEQLRTELEKQKDLFDKELNKYQNMFSEVVQFNDIDSAKNKYRAAFELYAGIEKAVAKAKELNDDEGLLEIKKTEYSTLDKLGKDFQPFYTLIKFSEDIQLSIDGWKTNPFISLKPSEIEDDIKHWNASLETLNKQLEEYKDQADVALQLKNMVADFTLNLELIKCLRSEAMKEEEFNEISKATPLEIKASDDTYSLNTLIKKNALAHMDQIRDIWERAERKLDLDKNLKKIKDEVHKKRLEVVKYTPTNSFVIQSYDGIMEYLDEQIALTQNMLSSPFMTGLLRKNCAIWSAKFGTIFEILEELKKCQRTWMYLEPIFSSEDIRLTLKREAEMFMEVDTKWRQQMENINADSLIVALLDKERLKEDFVRANSDLEAVLKSLSDFFESKRKRFPRFYFISDEDLIKVLSKAKQDPKSVEPYLSKCFDAMSSLEITEPKQEVVAVYSQSREKLELIRPLDLREGDKKGNVETWLREFERILHDTLRDLCKKAVKDYPTKAKNDWIFSWPCQVILACNQVHWTNSVEAAFKESRGKMTKPLETLENKLKDQIVGYTQLVRGELSPLNRLTLESVLVIDVHSKDIVRMLHEKNVTSDTAFDWSAQVRYSVEKDDIKVRALTATLNYGYEYLGSTSRLVMTPLTDRCFRTLIMAKHMNRGGALTGPAGTGKTETVKDLAKALGLYCVVFNGSDELDPSAMAKFFKGLASAGAWCCFDEFNKIEMEVLSVIASHILMIQQALGAEEKVFHFAAEDVVLNPQCGINITMNPNVNRVTDLPDNLKALFRPCAVTAPDHALIAEILLYSYGFQEPRTVARKVVAMLKLCKEQLSSTGHYDFGMRALKAILVTARELKRTHGAEKEDLLIRRALDDVNIPKLTLEDEHLYEGIATDLFPGITPAPRDYGLVQKALVEALQKERYQPKEQFVKKCLQIYETLQVRHGIMLIGETLSGKTTSMSFLRKALCSISDSSDTRFKDVRLQTLNPKAITMKQLFGYFEDGSHAWVDGVLTKVLREYVEAETPGWKWLVCDGPVDTVWMESMNTVLDDNKKLCLSSGAAINLKPNIALFFEVEDLKYASPAIVSRCGVVYMERQQLGWEILLRSYCDGLPAVLTPKRTKQVEDHMFSLVNPTLAFLAKHCRFPLQIAPMHMVQNFINIFDSAMCDWKELGYKIPTDIDTAIANLMVFAAIWAFGGCMEGDMRQKFREFLQDLLNVIDVKIKYKLDIDFVSPKFTVRFPESADIFSLSYDRKTSKWLGWKDNVTEVLNTLPKEAKFHEVIVPTAESERTSALLRMLLGNKQHMLFVGPTGTGKTICAATELRRNFLNAKYTYISVILSAQTSANQAQRTIECKLEKRGRKIYYGPLQGKQGVIFLDDLNMPQKDPYGAQPPIELLRQWMDYAGWYDIDSAERRFKYITDITFVAAMTPPASGREVGGRYLRHYNVVYMDHYAAGTLANMFTSILAWKLRTAVPAYSEELLKLSTKISEATIGTYMLLYKEQDLRPIPSKPHYTYNLRDVGKVFQGICRATPAAIRRPEDLIKLWAHEATRVFHDRLTTQQDRDTFMRLLKSELKRNFDRDWDSVVGTEALTFSDFVPCLYPDDDKTKPPLSGVYCEVTDRALLKSTAESYLAKYNASRKSKLNIVLFSAAVEHIVQILRVLALPLGHALLLGLGSSGRKSLTALASFIGGFELFKIEVSRKYKVQEWHSDLRMLMFATGVERTPTVFVLNDQQIKSDYFLEDLNNLLNTGEVPNLYSKLDRADSKDDYMTKLRENMQSRYKKVFNSDDEILETLREHSREQLHIAFCMNPVGPAFRYRVRMFPSLVNCTTINCFLPWPEEGLRSVASQALTEVEGLDKVRDGIVSICVDMQERVRLLAEKFRNEARGFYYVTPAGYLELLKIFKNLLLEKRSSLQAGIRTYENGLEELRKTEQFVAQMKTKLSEMEPELKKRSDSAAQLADSLKKKQAEVAEETKVVQKEQEKAEETKKTADELQAECQADLDKAMPELGDAEREIGSIKQEAIADLASMGAPPDEVKLVAKALCIMLEIKPKKGPSASEPDYWMPKKIFTFKMIKKCMVDFDKEKANIPLPKITELRKVVEDPKFATDKLKSVSEPGETIARWIRAIVKFDQVNREVAPKKAKLDEETAKAKTAQEVWTNKNKQLEDKRALLAELNQKSQSAEAQKKQLVQEIEATRKKIDRARELLDLLKSENKRWNDQRSDMQARYNNILGDMLVSSGIIAYLGVFPATYRESCVASWSVLLQKFGIPRSENFSLFNALGDPLQKLIWQKLKLPTDSISTDNAIILERTTRWTLMIDPQLQAIDWIKRKGSVEVLKAKQKMDDILKRLAICMASGVSVLLEDLDETIDSRLNPLLQKDVSLEGKRRVIRLGDEVVNFTSGFNFYMTTKLAKPHYSPEVCSLVTILNFSVTEEGLIDQSLNIIVKKEEPNTEKSREEVINKSVDIKKKLKVQEEEILKIVTVHKEGILESDKLLETLKNTKTECQQFSNQVEEQKRFSERIENTRSKFKTVAKRVADLYFCIADLSNVESMYQFSLDWYLDLYKKSLQAEQGAETVDKLEFYKNKFTHILFNAVCKSLFERDKLLFALSLYIKIAVSEGRNTPEEVRFLATGPTSLSAVSPIPAGESWISEKMWRSICELSRTVTAFKDFDKDFAGSLAGWKLLCAAPELALAGGKVTWPTDRFNPLERLILVSVLKPDRFVEAAQQLVAQGLGKEFCEYPPYNLEDAFNLSSHKKPIIIILSPGADAIDDLRALAVKRNMHHGLVPISLGKGQGKTAKIAFDQALRGKEGNWVILQNCQLATSYLPTIEKMLEEIPEDPKLPFRLWLTTTPSPEFPVSMLQNAVKVTNERPRGIVRNMLQAYSGIEASTFTETGPTGETLRKLTFSLCLFHATVVERCKFGSLGWNAPYSFSSGDLQISLDQLKHLLKIYYDVPWDALNYFVADANYGGRISDPADARCIQAILSDFYNPDVLKDGYRFCKRKEYCLPRGLKTKDDYLKLIRSLPLADDPEIFGLSETASVTCATNEAGEIQRMLQTLQPQSGSGLHELVEEVIAGKAQTILHDMSRGFDRNECLRKYPILYTECMNSVLQQEVSRHNALLDTMRDSLTDLQKALKGYTMMSKELEDIANSIYQNKVPELWTKCGGGNHKPLASWLKDLAQGVQFFQEWIDKGPPMTFWFAAFFYPHTFLTGVLQNCARKRQLPFDDLAFEHTVVAESREELTKPESGGFYVHGLYIEGAKWSKERKQLTETEIGVIFTQMPHILMRPIELAKLVLPENVSFVCCDNLRIEVRLSRVQD